MLTRNEFRQLFTVIVPMSQHRVNGRVQVDAFDVLNLIATFCSEHVRIELTQGESANGSVFRAHIGERQQPSAADGEAVKHGECT